MPTTELLLLLLLGAGVWFWLDGLKSRDAGKIAARAACDADGLQFLDDTVAASRVRFSRDNEGRLRLLRSFDFEYSDTGDNRRNGSVTLMGREVVMLNIGLRAVDGDPRALHR